jgi:hypothetical protein
MLFGALALVFNGCIDGPISTNLTVKVVNQLTGDPVANTDVRLLDITTVFTTNASGIVIIPEVPNDLHALLIVPPEGIAPALVGPFYVTGSRTVIAETLTYSQLLATYQIARPTNNTATVIAFGYTRLNGSSPPREVELTVDNTTATGTPAVVTGTPVPPAPHDITVIDTATDSYGVFPSFQLPLNSVLVVQAAFEGIDD